MSNDNNTKNPGLGTFKVKLKSPVDHNKLTSGPDYWIVANREPRDVSISWSSDATRALILAEVVGPPLSKMVWQVKNEDPRIEGKYLTFDYRGLLLRTEREGGGESWELTPYEHGHVIFVKDSNGTVNYVGNNTTNFDIVGLVALLKDAVIIEVR